MAYANMTEDLPSSIGYGLRHLTIFDENAEIYENIGSEFIMALRQAGQDHIKRETPDVGVKAF